MPEQLRGNPRQTPAQQVRRRHEHRSAPPAGPEGASEDQPRAIRHTVQRGETLIGLARRYYGPDRDQMYTRIYEANGEVIPDPNNLPVGQEILIPAAGAERPGPDRRETVQPRYTRYTIVEGDSLTKIARKVLGDDSHQAVRKIYDANTDVLASPDRLIVGTEIRIPR
jgi:nucleoid-associated protein YgaU